ncbi:MAG: winged helix-turn-helix domain-containing protein, partial [Pseudomonadota bacterium]
AKPFEPEELELRIAAVLRRRRPEDAQAEIRISGLLFDSERGELSHGTTRIRLTDSEAALLARLAATPGEPVSREDLAEATSSGLERAIDVQVTRLRRKIEKDPRDPMHLQTVRGIGYRLLID